MQKDLSTFFDTMASASDKRVFDMIELKRALLECPVCIDTTRAGQDLELKLLECHHTVCKGCLDQLIDGKTDFHCPLCCRPMRVPAQGVDGIQNNFYAQQIRDYANSCKPKDDVGDAALKERVKCGRCKDEIRKVLHQCVSCGYLCSTCTWQHRDSKDLRHHTIFIQGRSSQTKKTTSNFCGTHDLCRLDFYCRTCRVALCKLCKEFHDTGPLHSVRDVCKEAQETWDETDSLLDVVINRQSLAFEVFRKVRCEEERVATESREAKEKLKAFIRECHNVLSRREMELIGSIDHRSKQMSKCLKYSKERAQDLLAKIGSSMDYADQIKEERDPLSVIRAAAALKPALLDIEKTLLDADIEHDDSFLSVTDGDLQFDVAAFEHMVSLLGKSCEKSQAEDAAAQQQFDEL
ncbi:E3 ubiquitin-protein ligase TRIM71-like [Patiria miniata]|uniref:E3 ubiquitin-protein ligase TRIM56 n=1 Tax=Patiria miniata TaxID=46514 RepID=A0A913Z0S2_PATMI|nr:E3 ubiquitin-protein ligase TRIM71-like [Patiria miniata]